MKKETPAESINRSMHRLLADGVHYRDAIDIRNAITEPGGWLSVWSQWAKETERRADEALGKGNNRTAGEGFARASLYYHYAQYLWYNDVAAKERTHGLKVAAFHRAAPLLDPPAEIVSVPFEDTTLPGYLRLPRNVKSPPCVILQGGLDTTKEDYLVVSNICLQRGLATLAFDGPGQGEVQFRLPWRRDNHKATSAVVDYLEKRPEIDRNRIGLIGRSMGGFYAPRTTADDKRIKACAAWGAMYHLRNIADIPHHTLEGLIYVSRSKGLEEAREFFMSVNLEGHASRIECPLLVVHGGLDKITPMDNATKLVKEARGKTEMFIWEDSIHCCHDRSHIVRPGMADFMLRNL